MAFYESLSAAGDLQQGDILASVPFIGFSVTNAVVRTPGKAAPYQTDLTQTSEELPDNSQILANVSRHSGIVLNQSCDLSGNPDRGKPIVVSRLLPAENRVKEFKASNNLKKDVATVRNIANPGKYPNLFYLPAATALADFELPRSVADLYDVTRYSPRDFAGLTGLVRLRLSPEALTALQERLAYCYGRFGAPDGLYMSEDEWTFAFGSKRESA